MKYFVSFNLLVSALVLSTSLTLAQNHVIINTDMDGLHLSGDNSVLSLSGTHTASGITVDPGTTFTSLQINAGSADLTNVFTLKDSDLSGVKFIDSTNAWSALVGKVGASYHNAVVSNTKFTNASFEAYGSTWATCFTFYNAGFDNVDFSGATFKGNASFNASSSDPNNGRSEALWISCSTLNNVNFSNIKIELSSDNGTGIRNPVTLSGAANGTYTVMTNVDFRGATVKIDSAPVESLGIKHIHLSSDGNRAQMKNVLLGDGTILSADMNWVGNDAYSTFEEYGQVNAGLWLKDSGDRFTVRGGDISAKLTVDSYASAGSIELLNGALFELSDDVTLTLSDEVSIIFDANTDVSGIEDLMIIGNGSTIVMAGYESDADAQAAFVNLFQDSEGKGVDWSSDSVANFVVAGPAVPEPSTYAVIFGAFALIFAAYRRRK